MLVFFHEDFAGHQVPDGHPECPERMAAVARGLAGLAISQREAPEGAEADVLRCHPAPYLARVKGAAVAGELVALDFDVHHGNGTQDLLWDEARVRLVSSQQMPLFPGTGAADERGAHGQIVNLPLRPGSGGAEMWAMWQPALEELRAWRPELLLVSAGFDAHRDDPLAALRWTVADFARLTRAIVDLAQDCGAGVVSCLEGGYDLGALEDTVRAHVSELCRMDP